MSRESVAVVGSGVSGMTAAHILQHRYDVTVFEARDRVGGNADTRDALLPDGTRIPVDLAVMAYGADTYPAFARLLAELGVASRPANVALDVVCGGCGYAYVARGEPKPPSRGAGPAAWDRFVADLERFPDDARKVLESGGAASVGDFLAAHGYSDYFFQHFVYPRSAPWFINDPGSVLAMSMEFLVTALSKYGVLDSTLVPGWRVVDGGCRAYLRRIAERLTAVRTSLPIRTIHLSAHGVELRDDADRTHSFDRAVVAVPAPTALTMLTAPTPRARKLLGAFRYVPMNVTLHSDMSVYDKAQPTHNSIRMRVDCAEDTESFRGCVIDASVLQSLGATQPLIISYNPDQEIDPEKIFLQSSYVHPVFTVEAFAAQAHLPELSDDRLAFAGSYFGSSLHEDGCAAGVQAAERFGVSWQR